MQRIYAADMKPHELSKWQSVAFSGVHCAPQAYRCSTGEMIIYSWVQSGVIEGYSIILITGELNSEGAFNEAKAHLVAATEQLRAIALADSIRGGTEEEDARSALDGFPTMLGIFATAVAPEVWEIAGRDMDISLGVPRGSGGFHRLLK